MSYQLGVIPRFPARVAQGVGVRIDRANAVYTFSTDYSNVAPVDVADPANSYVLVQLPDGTYGKVSIDEALTSVTPIEQTGKKNAFLNGGMLIWQRTVTDTGVTTTRKYVADRWAVKTGLGTLAAVQRLGSSAPSRSNYTMGLTGNAGVTTVDVDQRIEAVNIAALRYGASCITFSAQIVNLTGALLAPTLFVETPTAVDVWTTSNVQNGSGDVLQSCPNNATTKVSWTGTVTTYTDIDKGLAFRLRFPSGALDINTKSIRVADVQVEPVNVLGDPPTLFEVETFSDELARCQRYYQKSFPYATIPAQNAGVPGALGFSQTVAAAAGMSGVPARFVATMRSGPTIVFFNPSAANAFARNTVVSADCSTTTAAALWDAGFAVTATTAAGSAAGQSNLIHYTADAEL